MVVLGVAGVGGAVAGEFHGVEDRSGENSSKKSKFTLSIHSSPTCLEAEVPSPVGGSSKVSSHSSRKRDITPSDCSIQARLLGAISSKTVKLDWCWENPHPQRVTLACF